MERCGAGAAHPLLRSVSPRPALHPTHRPRRIPLRPDGLDIRREHAKGDLALRGAVSDIELALYDRPPIGEVERFGDESVLDAWYRVFKFG